MTPLSTLVLLQARRTAALARLVARLLKALKIKVSAHAVILGGSAALGLGLVLIALRRNQRAGGQGLWPLVLPSTVMAGLIAAGIAGATTPTVDLSATTTGILAPAVQTVEAPRPTDPLDSLREYFTNPDGRIVTIGFQMAGDRGEGALPVADLMQEVLMRETESVELRMKSFLRVLPPDRLESALLAMTLEQANRSTKIEAICVLGQRGNATGLQQLGDVFERMGHASEDEWVLRRGAMCAQTMPTEAKIRLASQIKKLLERMCEPPHTQDGAWSGSGTQGYGDPLGSIALWREATKAYWAISPSAETKQFLWDLLENAPFKARNDRRIIVNEVARPGIVPRSSP